MEITVSTGVKFKVKKAPSMAFQAVARQWEMKAPKVPVVLIEAKGRKEENPSDPDYVKALKKFEEDKGLGLFDAAILLCTEVVSIPENMEASDKEDWLENLKLIGICPGNGKRERYLSWVKYYAAPMDEDMVLLNNSIARENGVSEGDVSAAMAALKSAQERAADRDLSPERAS